MSGSLPSPHLLRDLAPKRLLKRLLQRNDVGVNVAPGDADDGWVAPPPVQLADGSRVVLLKDGEALRRAYDAIKAAKHRVCFEFYIWDQDATGLAFADLLYEKAREGVQVYVIYDGFGIFGNNDRTMFDRLRRAGARVAEFHPIRPWECNFGWRPYSRDHRKLIVVDDEFAGVGGLNIADPYAGAWVVDKSELKPAELWRDTAIGVSGPAVRMFFAAFVRNWRYLHRGGRTVRAMYVGGLHVPRSPKGFRVGKAHDRDAPQPIIAPDHMGLLATTPTLASPLRPLLNDLLASARSSIRMTMAYFAPDDALIRGLCNAARRGVRVRLMLGEKTDIQIMVTAARSFYETLLSAGVEIYERKHVVLHAKSLTVDDEISIIGSTNLDYRSIELNCEISAVVRNREFASQVTALFEHDVQYARRIHHVEWQGRPWRDRFVQWVVSRLRYFL